MREEQSSLGVIRLYTICIYFSISVQQVSLCIHSFLFVDLATSYHCGLKLPLSLIIKFKNIFNFWTVTRVHIYVYSLCIKSNLYCCQWKSKSVEIVCSHLNISLLLLNFMIVIKSSLSTRLLNTSIATFNVIFVLLSNFKVTLICFQLMLFPFVVKYGIARLGHYRKMRHQRWVSVVFFKNLARK